MKKVFIILFSLFLCVIPIFASAETFNVTGSVNENTTQISILISTLQNQSDFDPFQPWVGMRTGDYDYSVFYNIKDNGQAQRLRYYATSSGYSQTWHFTHTSVNSLYYYSNDYTLVGSGYDQLGSSRIETKKQNTIWLFTVPFILVILIFFVFRIRKRSKGGINIR